MYITPKGMLIFIGTLLLLYGVWQFIWLKVTLEGYKIEKQGKETFFDFCVRYYGGFGWNLRKKLGLKSFYNTRFFRVSVRIRGVLLILLSIVIFGFLLFVSQTDYAPWLDIKF